MCGISGIVDSRGPVDPNLVERMSQSLSHRGPDAHGMWHSMDRRVVFAHRRLSIIDLSQRGTQPLSNEDGSVVAMVNGEIYNHVALRRQLLEKGHVFRSDSDSEVIVHGYEEWGREVVCLVRGIFALAVWDESKSELFLARDRFGVKPLYVSTGGDRIAFASEARALLPTVDAGPKINMEALRGYLAHRSVPGEQSIFDGIEKLLPGHTLTMGRDRIAKVEAYWRPPDETADMGFDDAVTMVRAALLEAVELELGSDVPVAIALSGGVDSSCLVAIADRVSGVKHDCFTVGFVEDEADERPYAELVTRELGGTHHVEVLTRQTAESLLPDLCAAFDEPFFDTSALPTLFLSKAVRRKGFKVLLSGEGGDELFAGYTWYDDLSRRTPVVSKRLPVALRNSWTRRRFLEPYFGKMGYFDESEQRELFGDDSAYDHLALFRRHMDDRVSDFQAAQRIDIHTFLPDDLLTKLDRCLMACGVEGRVPLLDVRVAETALQLNPFLHRFRGVRKAVLKQACGAELPQVVLGDRKKGFSVPLGTWIRESLGRTAEDFLVDGYFSGTSIWRRSGIRRFLRSGSASQVWVLFMAELWARHWLCGEDVRELMAGAGQRR
jgi:asparagine synthase (glutamine-hydrolysing)